MRKEELLEAFGAIGSGTVERNAPYMGRSMAGRAAGWRRWAAFAASFAAIAGAGILAYRQMDFREEVLPEIRPGQITGVPGSETPESGLPGTDSPGSELPAKEAGNSANGESYVDVKEILASSEGNITEEVLRIAEVKIGPYTARYREIPAAHAELLEDSLGGEVEGNEGWFRLSGHGDAGYLLSDADGECALWEFGYFISDEYPYRDVLELIYGVTSPDEIKSVSVKPSRVDNTDAGRKLQQEIGTREITDEADLEKLYHVLTGLTCYGHNHWDRIDYGANDAGMLDAVRYGRMLTITLRNGIGMEALQYTAVSGMFYEYGGVAYNRLSEQDKKMVEDILGIERPFRSSELPVEETVYREAHGYSEEVESIQAAISDAMMKKELPFVTSSAILENPVRIEVRVNTREEELLQKVRDLDTVGGIVEIVYSESMAALE